MTLKIPTFLNIAHDEAQKKASLSVADPSLAHQRAMWGTLSICIVPVPALTALMNRDNSSTFAKLHSRCLRRPCLHSEFGWCGLQSFH